jgi:biphenyl 2,3-dioxygenase alpha subunit
MRPKWAWTVVDRDWPDAVKDAYRRGVLRSFSAAGTFEQDDGENWNEIRACCVAIARSSR